MVVETKNVVKKCDSCNAVIPERSAFVNDGSFQRDSLDIGNVNVCVSCCGKIMIRFMSDGISEAQLLEWAVHRSIQKNPYHVQLMNTDPLLSMMTTPCVVGQDGSILNTPVIT